MSGVSTENIINKMLDAQTLRIVREQNRKGTVQAQQEAWLKVKSAFESLRSKLDGIRLASAYQARQVSLSDATVAAVTVAPGAMVTSHSLSVSQLAQAHAVAAADVSDPNAVLGLTGTLTVAGQEISLSEQETLHSLRDKLNATGSDQFRAEVVRVMKGTDTFYRLVVTARNQGAGGAVSFADDQAGALLQGLGFTDGLGALNELAAAQDAKFTLNNVAYETATNRITDILPNMSITLLKGGSAETPVSTTIAISQDTNKTVQAVSEWVSTVNSVQGLIKELTAFNADSRAKGILQGDAVLRGLQSTLRRLVTATVPSMPANLSRLHDLGITTGAFGTPDYGTFVVDKSKLADQIQADEAAVARLFGAIPINVALASSGAIIIADQTSATAAGPYAAADAINGDAEADRFGSLGGGWQSALAPTAEAPVTLAVQFAGARSINEVRLYTPEFSANAGLKAFELQYRDGEGNWQTIKAVSDHGSALGTFTFDSITTDAVRLVVTATQGDGAVQISELSVHQTNSGPANAMYRFVSGLLTSETGTVDARSTRYTSQLAAFDRQIERMREQLLVREERLKLQFARMEEALAKLQAQGNSLTMYMTQLSQSQIRR